MNRRRFLKVMGASGTILVIWPLNGCNATAVENEINVVLKEAAAVLAVAAPGAAWVTQLQVAIAALATAEQQWQTGGAVQIVIDALNTIVAITAVIPITAAYSPLIDVLVAAIEVVLAALPAATSSVATRLSSDELARTVATGNQHIGRYKLKTHWYHSAATNLKDNWNDVARANNLPAAILP
jgi:hypothetical protein